MKGVLNLLWLALGFPSYSLALACETKILMRDNQQQNHKICYQSANQQYVSPACWGQVKKCFFKRPIKMQSYLNQSPGFSLCYQLGGNAFFATMENAKNKIPMCQLAGHYVDHSTLIHEYKKIITD